eukprot:Sspe_Gene.114957::Locus_101354_Transcript_2_2_Confidence_0.600_Length_389::g.114957::m.114957
MGRCRVFPRHSYVCPLASGMRERRERGDERKPHQAEHGTGAEDERALAVPDPPARGRGMPRMVIHGFPGLSEISDAVQQELVTAFCPRFWLHKKEEYFPSDVEGYM